MSEEQTGIELRLNDILDEIRRLRDETTGIRYETFAATWLLRRASIPLKMPFGGVLTLLRLRPGKDRKLPP